MRALLTYALAALAAAVVFAAIQLVMLAPVLAADAIERGVAPVLLMAIFALSATFLGFAIFAVAGSLVWLLAEMLRVRFLPRLRPMWLPLEGFIAFLLIGAVGVWASLTAILGPFGIPPGTELGNDAFAQMSLRVLPAAALPGLAWGVIFWLRRAAPEPMGSTA